MSDVAAFDGQVVSVRAPKAIYTESSVLKATYWVLGEYAAFVGETETDFIIQVIVPHRTSLTSETRSPLSVAQLVSQHLVDARLRDVVVEQTRSIRDMIVARALASVGTLDSPPGDYRDPVDAGLDYAAL